MGGKGWIPCVDCGRPVYKRKRADRDALCEDCALARVIASIRHNMSTAARREARRKELERRAGIARPPSSTSPAQINAAEE